MASMAFDIFARDHASRVFDRVGDNAERLGRRIDHAGSSTGGLRDGMAGLTGVAGSLAGRMASVGASLAAAAGKAVAMAGAAATLAASAASAAGATVSLAAGLAPLAGLLAGLPGIALAGGAAMTVWKLATAGLGEAMSAALSGSEEALANAVNKLSEVGKQFIADFLQIKNEFLAFRGIAQDAFLQPIIGQLERWLSAAHQLGPAIADLASQFGWLVRRLLDFATGAQTIDRLNSVLGDTATLVAAFDRGMEPLLTGFLDLGVVGTAWLASLNRGLTDALTRFGSWMSEIAASGQALAWLNDAAAVLKTLGTLVMDVWGIFTALLKAADTAGAGVLGVLSTLMDRLNAFLNSAQGQDILVSIFKALTAVGSALVPVVTALAVGLAGLAPIVARLAELIGPILTTAVQALAPALQALGPGLVAVFTSLGTAVETLASSGALTDIATALADILIAAAPLLPMLADLLVPILQGLALLVSGVVAPALSTLVGWIRDVAAAISGAPLADDHPLKRFADFLNTTLVPAVKGAWDWVVQAFAGIGEWVNANRGTFEVWGARIAEIVELVKGVWQQIIDVAGQVFTDLATWIAGNQSTWMGWGDRIISIVTSLVEIVSGAWEAVALAWDTFGGPLLDLIGGVFSGILQIVDGVMQAVSGLINAILGVITGDWERAWNGVKDFFGGIWEAILGVLNIFWAQIKGVMSAALATVGETWDGAWSKAKTVVENAWNIITAWVSARVNDVKNAVARLGELPGQVSAWFDRVRQAIIDKFNEAVAFVQSIPGRIVGVLGNLGGLLYNSGRSIIQGLIDGLYSMLQNAYNAAADILNQIRNLFPFSPAKEGPFSGKGWTLYSGQSMAEALAQGLSRGEGLVAAAADRLMGAAALSVTPSVAVGATGVVPLVPQGGLVINLHFAAQPLIGRDEIYRLLISALNEAKGRGFNLGNLGAV